MICPSSSLFCASSWSTSGFKLSLSSELSVSGGIPSLNQPRATRSTPRPRVKPTQRGEQLQFIGEINERDKTKFLGEALALLFPVDWPEPFGIVMIEAMACGTPVLAFRRGSVPEIVDNGVTGQIVDTEEEAIRMLPQVLALDRHAVRRRFEARFSATRMAKDYIQVYRSLMRRPLPITDADPGIAVVRPTMEASVN